MAETKEVVFTPSEFEQVSKYLIGSQNLRPMANVFVPQGKVCERMSCEEFKIFIKIYRYSPKFLMVCTM